MILNKYFILNLPEPALNAILTHVVGTVESQRKSLDGKKTVVKLPVGASIPAVLQNKTAYTHSEILQQLSSPEWSSPDII